MAQGAALSQPTSFDGPREPGSKTPAAGAAGAGEAVSARGHAATILLVEDNESLINTMRMMLEELGYRVRHVGTGRRAFQLIESGEPIDLVFTDIVMPGELSGLQLAMALRRIRPELPVILCTGFTGAGQEAIDE